MCQPAEMYRKRFFWFSLATWLHFFSRLKCKNRLAHKKTVLVVLMFIPTILPYWIHSKDWYLFCMLLYPLWQHRTWGLCVNNGRTQGITFTALIFSCYNLKCICSNLSIYKISVYSKTEGQEGKCISTSVTAGPGLWLSPCTLHCWGHTLSIAFSFGPLVLKMTFWCCSVSREGQQGLWKD